MEYFDFQNSVKKEKKRKKKRSTHLGEASVSVCRQFVVHTEDDAHFPVFSQSFPPHFIPLPVLLSVDPPFTHPTLCDQGAVWEPPHASML